MAPGGRFARRQCPKVRNTAVSGSPASAAQAVANSSLTAAIVRTGRIEADAPRGEAVEVAPQGALPAGATISPTQVPRMACHPRAEHKACDPRFHGHMVALPVLCCSFLGCG